MSTDTFRPWRIATAALAFALAAPAAQAAEKPLIWNFSKASDTDYTAQVGANIPAPWALRAGADLRVRGPDPVAGRSPVALWTAVDLPGVDERGRRIKRRLDLRLTGSDGARSVSFTGSRALDIGTDISMAFDHVYALEDRPGTARRLRARVVHELKLTSKSRHTKVFARTAKADDAWRWNTSVGIEQPVREKIRLRAGVTDARRPAANGFFRASYGHKW